MPTYRLHYFDFTGKGELIRLLFSLAGEQFEDVRYSKEERPGVQLWNEESKSGMPLGSMPVLEIDGVKFCQQSAIARHLAKKFGFYGKNDFENLKVDMVLETVWGDMAAKMIAIVFENDETKKAEKKAKMLDELPEMMKKVEKWFEGDFVLSSGISLADLVIFDFQKLMNEKFLPELKFTSKWISIHDRVITNEKIKAWLDSKQ